MIEQKRGFDKQISEFFYEYKNRFVQIQPYIGMPGKVGYSAKLNRQDVISNLQVFIPERFPVEAPIFKVIPAFNHELIDQTGRVNDDCLRNWNIYSSLKGAVNEVLGKLEGKIPLNSQQKISPQMNHMQPQQNLNTEDEEKLVEDLENKLRSKSIEELIYINFNPEQFVSEFTQPGRDANEKLLQEVKNLSNVYEQKKVQYEEIKSNIEKCRLQYEQKEMELRNLYNQREKINGLVTVDKLIEEMKKYIDENFQKPRQKLINEFLAKKISFDDFKEQFKTLTTSFHYYSIIKDKLNLCK